MPRRVHFIGDMGEEQDLQSLAPQTSIVMQIVKFVRFSEIDPAYLETSYLRRS